MKKSLDERQEQQANKIGTVSFLAMFLVCPVVIIVQMLFFEVSLGSVVGETVIMLAGGLVYLTGCIRNGLFTGNRHKPAWKNLIESVMFSGVFSLIYAAAISKKAGGNVNITKYVGLFFVGITVLCFAVLSVLEWFSRKQEKKQEEKYSD